MDKSIKIDGDINDYQIITINPDGAHPTPLLVGVSAHTKGIMISLDQIKIIHFSQESIDLRLTVWGETNVDLDTNTLELDNFYLPKGEYHVSDLQYISNEPQINNSQFLQSQITRSLFEHFSDINHPSSPNPQISNKIPQEKNQEESGASSNNILENSFEKYMQSYKLNSASFQITKTTSEVTKTTSNSLPKSSAKGGLNSNNVDSPSDIYNSKLQIENPIANNAFLNVDYFPKNLFGSLSNDLLRGAEGDDFFYTSDGSDFMFGYGGQDTLVGVNTFNIEISQIAQGLFTLKGELFNIEETEGGDIIYGNSINNGDIFFTSIEFFKQYEGDISTPLAMLQLASEFDDNLIARNSRGSWQVDGLRGNDNLWGSNADDSITGGLGDDVIDSGNNSIASNGNFYEILSGDEGRDTIIYHGFYGDIIANSIEANVFGGLGNDVIGVKLDDLSMVKVSGGEGQDILSLDGNGQNIWDPNFIYWSFVLSNSNYLVQGISQKNIQGAGVYEIDPTIEKISLGLGNSAQTFNLIRPALGNELNVNGTNNDDLLIGINGAINQILDAGSGNDVVIMPENGTVSLGTGINQLFSNSNDYTLSYDWSNKGVRVDLANQLGIIFDDAGDFVAIDRFNFSPNQIKGSSSADIISGNENSNILFGGSGNDQIISGGGDDFIFGGEGNDIITASGSGHSTLEGGLGSDEFILNFDFITGSFAEIQDFNINQGDTFLLNLSALQLSDHFGFVELSDMQGNSLFSEAIENGNTSNIFNLLINQENKSLNYMDSLNQIMYPIVDAEIFLNELTIEQWADIIQVSYL